jgi:hypothetical protein
LGFTSTYILVHWVGYEPMTLRIETSSPTTRPVGIPIKKGVIWMTRKILSSYIQREGKR